MHIVLVDAIAAFRQGRGCGDAALFDADLGHASLHEGCKRKTIPHAGFLYRSSALLLAFHRAFLDRFFPILPNPLFLVSPLLSRVFGLWCVPSGLLLWLYLFDLVLLRIFKFLGLLARLLRLESSIEIVKDFCYHMLSGRITLLLIFRFFPAPDLLIGIVITSSTTLGNFAALALGSVVRDAGRVVREWRLSTCRRIEDLSLGAFASLGITSALP